MQLLFVDDESNILKALRRLFRGSEYQVHIAESAADGLLILEQRPIDLIISDMRMPKMDGAEFLSLAAEKWPETIRILLTGYADLESTIKAVNQGKIYGYCSKPWVDDELKILVRNAIEQKRLRDERQKLFAIIHQQNAELKELNNKLEDKVELRTQQLRLSLEKIDHAHSALKKQYTDSIKAFVKIIEMRPGIKSGHSLYIAENARTIAERLEMPPSDVKDVLYAGLLSQIGKMGLPDHLLSKSLNTLSSAEKKRYMLHGQEGWELLKGIDQLKKSAEMIRYQYEYFDGTGEPNAFQQDEIPLGSRILSVVRDYICYLDGFMTGQKMTTEQGKQVLSSRKNKAYDPAIVDVFLQLLAESAHPDIRPILEITWTQLQVGMEAAEIICNDVLYLKDTILNAHHIETILEMRKDGKSLILRVRV